MSATVASEAILLTARELVALILVVAVVFNVMGDSLRGLLDHRVEVI